MTEISHVLEDVTWRLMSLPNVVGVGRGYKTAGDVRTSTECIMVLVKNKYPRGVLYAQAIIPGEVRGIPTDVVEVGEIRFLVGGPGEVGETGAGMGTGMGTGAGTGSETGAGLGDRSGRQRRMRPAQPGASIGHYQTTAGTFGAVVWDRRTGEPYILSCNHVLANATSGHDGRAKVGDPVVQPGAADGGTVERDQIAVLERFVPIRMSGRVPPCLASRAAERAFNSWLRVTGARAEVEIVPKLFLTSANIVDVALARPLNLYLVDTKILELGEVQGVARPELGMQVGKSGRTTRVTRGEITSIDTTVSVVYSGNVTATFRDQILTGPMAEGGDSGSLLVDEDVRAVGLLFAGSDKSTIYNKITNVTEALGVTFERP